MPESGPAANRRRPQALRRHRAAALIALLLAATAAEAIAKPNPPPKPPRPRVTLVTTTELGVLRQDRIKIGVEAKRADEVEVKARFVIDGFPEDYPFRLGPATKRVREGNATVSFGLSQRQHEVLDFAAKTCHGANLAITAKTEKRTGRLSTSLGLPADCASSG